MIIVLGQDQAFVEPFAQWLRDAGHFVEIDPEEPESFVADGNAYSLEDLFSVFSDGEQ